MEIQGYPKRTLAASMSIEFSGQGEGGRIKKRVVQYNKTVKYHANMIVCPSFSGALIKMDIEFQPLSEACTSVTRAPIGAWNCNFPTF